MMEERSRRHNFPSKQCQIEGCEEISVGSKVPLCRKHRNKTYKQNYKKKKRNAEANSFEENSQEIVIDDQYLLEQKYSNMLQDVLTQKQMELFESSSVVNLLKNYQKQKQIARNNPKKNRFSTGSFNISGKSEERQQSKGLEDSSTFQPENPPSMNQITFSPSINFARCNTGEWNQAQSSISSHVITTCDTSLCSLSSTMLQRPSCTSYVSASTTFQGENVFRAVP